MNKGIQKELNAVYLIKIFQYLTEIWQFQYVKDVYFITRIALYTEQKKKGILNLVFNYTFFF